MSLFYYYMPAKLASILYDSMYRKGKIMDSQLQILFNQYEKNIKHLICLCEGKTIVSDFDGTLTRFQYAKNRMLPCKDADIEEYTQAGGDIYANIYILKTMEYIFKKFNKPDIFILTSTVPSLREEKNKIILDHFDVLPSQIIHTHNSTSKLDVLDQIYAQTKKEIIFLEDNYKILLHAEETKDFVKGYHISSLIA